MRKALLLLLLAAPASAQQFDSAGRMLVNSKPFQLGQQTMANSGSCVIASDQTAIPVSGSGSFTVSGSITANQGGTWNIGTLTSITNPVAVTGTFWPTTAASPLSARLTDGSSFYVAPNSGQLPAALVSSRLDTNLGAWMGSTAATVGQKAMASSLPVAISSDQTAIPASQSGTWNVGTVTTVTTVGTITNPVAATQSGSWSVTATPTTAGTAGSAPPATAEVNAGVSSGVVTRLATNPIGALIVIPQPNSLPRPYCNAVRRINCQP